MRVAIVSTYPPRPCGLATFTTDLRQALLEADRTTQVLVAPVLDDGPVPAGPEVCTTIRQHVREDYTRAAGELAQAGVDVVLVQHEYGIFGGDSGSYMLDLTRALTVPYVVTLHTMISRPSHTQARVLAGLTDGAAEVTVFSAAARDALLTSGCSHDRVTVVNHGAPAALVAPHGNGVHERREPLRGSSVTELQAHAGRRVLSTFGLLSEGKGIEVALRALPEVVRSHPDVVYVVAGRTHPVVARSHGEEYRRGLEQLTSELGLDDHVLFLDRYLSDAEIADLLASTTLFLTPYHSPEQVVSGVLTFAVAAGCPVVSTPYSYATELLSTGAGRLVPFNDHRALADAVQGLLGDEQALRMTAHAARQLGSQLTWPAVGRETLKLLHRAAEVHEDSRPGRSGLRAGQVAPPRLDQLRRLVDDLGIVQHARGLEPDRSTGYCVDDVARLLLVASGAARRGLGDAGWDDTAAMCVRFLAEAWDGGERAMRNLRAVEGRWLDAPHHGDHIGRALWGLGVAGSGTTEVARASRALLGEVLEAGPVIPSPRTGAFALLGLSAVSSAELGSEGVETMRWLGYDLLGRLRRDEAGWPWFEDELTYDNARLPEALLAAGAHMGEPDLIRAGLDSLEWYAHQCRLDTGTVVLVGNRWRRRPAGAPAPDQCEGDEQPVDAAALVEACARAFRVTGAPLWARRSRDAFAWFQGRNRWGAVMHDAESGGCHDGVGPHGLNHNEGAESTLAYLQAWLAVEQG